MPTGAHLWKLWCLGAALCAVQLIWAENMPTILVQMPKYVVWKDLKEPTINAPVKSVNFRGYIIINQWFLFYKSFVCCGSGLWNSVSHQPIWFST